MIAFELRINGDRCCIGQDVTAVTLVVDWVQRRRADRVSLHVGHPEHAGSSGERRVNWLDAHLGVGDEISIRIVDVVQSEGSSFENCSFCGTGLNGIQNLVSGTHVAICDGCISALDAAVASAAPLPLGASLQDDPKQACGFCGNGPAVIAGVVVRNGNAICPECLRSCAEIIGLRPGT